MNITLNAFLLTPLIVASYFFTPALQASSVDTAAIFMREAHDICRRSFGRADMPDALKEAAKKLNLAAAMLRDNPSDEPDRDEQLLIDIDILRTSAEREKGNPGAKMSASTRTPSDSTTSAQLSMLGSGQSLMQADQLHEEIRALRRDQKFEEVAAKLKEYVALLDSCLSPGNPDQAPALARLTMHFAEENSFKLAGVYAKRVVDDCEKRLGPDSLFLSMDLEWLAASQRGNENLKDAELTYKRIVAIREKAGGKNFKALPRVYSAIAGIYEDQCKWDLAEKFVKSAVAVREANYPAGDPVLANNAELYGDFHCNRGNLVKAEEFFKQALTIREKGYGPQAACLEGKSAKTVVVLLNTE